MIECVPQIQAPNSKGRRGQDLTTHYRSRVVFWLKVKQETRVPSSQSKTSRRQNHISITVCNRTAVNFQKFRHCASVSLFNLQLPKLQNIKHLFYSFDLLLNLIVDVHKLCEIPYLTYLLFF